MYETRTFEHDEKMHEVRIASDGPMINIGIFLDGKPVNGYEYYVEEKVQLSAHMSDAAIDPVEDQINTAIAEVKNGSWERYVAAVRASGR